MIVFGWGSGSKRLGDGFFGTCTNCHNSLQFAVAEASKKITVYWLPVVRWDRKYFYICPVCSHGFQIPSKELAQRIMAGAICDPHRPSPALSRDLRKAFSRDSSSSTIDPDARAGHPVRREPSPERSGATAVKDDSRLSIVEGVRPSVEVVEPKQAQALRPVDRDAAPVQPAVAASAATLETRQPVPDQPTTEEPDPVILRVDGTSSFLTLKEHQRRDWREAARCDLSNMKFPGVSFAGANLEGAKLDGSDFSGCSFRNAILTKITAQHSDFEGADFTGAKLLNADFQDSKLKKARFCSVIGADVVAAEIDQVNFGRCNMSEAVFVPAPPKGSADIGQWKARRTVFSGSDMSRCDLQGMDFRTCEFTDTSLFGASLERCNFEGVDLGSANLINANLSQVIVSNSSKFPEGFVLPADAKNLDVIRPAEVKAARESEGVLWMVIAFFFVGFIALVILVNGMSERRPAQGVKSTGEITEIDPPSQIRNLPGTSSSIPGQEREAVLLPNRSVDRGYRIERPLHGVRISEPFAAWELSPHSNNSSENTGAYAEIIVDISVPSDTQGLPIGDVKLAVTFHDVFRDVHRVDPLNQTMIMVLGGPANAKKFTYPFQISTEGLTEFTNTQPLTVMDGGVQIHLWLPADRGFKQMSSYSSKRFETRHNVTIQVASAQLDRAANLVITTKECR